MWWTTYMRETLRCYTFLTPEEHKKRINPHGLPFHIEANRVLTIPPSIRMLVSSSITRIMCPQDLAKIKLLGHFIWTQIMMLLKVQFSAQLRRASRSIEQHHFQKHFGSAFKFSPYSFVGSNMATRLVTDVIRWSQTAFPSERNQQHAFGGDVDNCEMSVTTSRELSCIV